MDVCCLKVDFTVGIKVDGWDFVGIEDFREDDRKLVVDSEFFGTFDQTGKLIVGESLPLFSLGFIA